MDNLNDLKEVWLTVNTNKLPDASQVVKTIKNYRLRQLLSRIALLIITLVLIATMSWVLVSYKSHLITTRIGEVSMFIAMFILLAVNTNAIKRTKGLKDYSNDVFLNYLKQEQIKQLQFQEKTQRIGFVFASAGLLLYLYEEVSQKTSTLVIAYTLAALWIGIIWFVLRPLGIKQKTRKLNERIMRLEKISRQLNN